MSNNITLSLDHPNKTRVEFFLNSLDAPLQSIPFDASHLHKADDIIGAFKFRNESALITVIFADTYFKANEIGMENAFHKLPNTKWTVNGDVLFIVESGDEYIIGELLGHFAGKE